MRGQCRRAPKKVESLGSGLFKRWLTEDTHTDDVVEVMYAVYGIPPDQLYVETVIELLPSYLRRTHNEREQQAMLTATKVGTMLFGDGKKGKGTKKSKEKGAAKTQSTRSDVKYVSVSQLMASMNARSVQA